MKRLEEVDFKKTYGDVPQSFQRRVEDALRQTKEEQPVKKFTLHTVLATVLIVILLAAAAYAAVTSRTADWFSAEYGEAWREAILKGDSAAGQSKRLGDVIYTLDEIVVTGIALDEDGLTNDDSTCAMILATGTMAPAPGARVVLMPTDYEITDPWNYLYQMHGGPDTIPQGAVSVAQKARETGSKILVTECVANGVVDVNGRLLPATIGIANDFKEDGTLFFSLEIGLEEAIPRQAVYTLSVSLSNWEADPETGDYLWEGENSTRLEEDWVFEIKPAKGEKAR